MGGIVGFSEPGRHHSQSPQSQYEMRNHRVLENDVDVNAIFESAKPAGFTRLSVKGLVDMEMSLDQHNQLFAPAHGVEHEQLKSELWNQTYNTMTNHAIFFLHKGALARDSRSHIGLAHTLSTKTTEYSISRSQELRIVFNVANTGEATWLHTNSEIFGIVRLASHLYDATGNLLSVDFSRDSIPEDVRPGAGVEALATIRIDQPGTYRLGFDLVAEGVTWFETLGSKPCYVTVTVR
jgi:hypothetical protein